MPCSGGSRPVRRVACEGRVKGDEATARRKRTPSAARPSKTGVSAKGPPYALTASLRVVSRVTRTRQGASGPVSADAIETPFAAAASDHAARSTSSEALRKIISRKCTLLVVLVELKEWPRTLQARIARSRHPVNNRPTLFLGRSASAGWTEIHQIESEELLNATSCEVPSLPSP